jgi:hypothetical protein
LANRFAGERNSDFVGTVKRGNILHPVVLSLKILPEKCSQFCRQPISKSVIIGDVPIAIREWEARGNSNRADRRRCRKSFIFSV